MSAAHEPGLSATDLERRHQGFRLGPVTIDVPRGRALGVLGSNGAGKTTLLAGLAGQARLQAGSVTWRGAAITRDGWRHRFSVSYVRDIPTLYGALTVGQTMAFVAALQPTWQARRADELLDRFALQRGKRVNALSRGMKAKLGLLLATCHEVELLLLDEVTAGVDADTRDEIQQFLRTLVVQERVSVVVSSHIFEDIEHVGDDILVLRHGAPVFSGAVTEPARCLVATVPHRLPAAVEACAELVGAWRGADGTCAMLRRPLPSDVEAALSAGHAELRPASLRDLYFAFKERT